MINSSDFFAFKNDNLIGFTHQRPHTIELQPVDEAEWDKMMKKSYKKYKKTLDELAK